MKKWLIILLAAIPLVMIALIAAVAVRVVVNCRDIPPPDVSDLVVERPEIPNESNAYVYLEKAGRLLLVDDGKKLNNMARGKWWDDVYASNLLVRNNAALEEFMRAAACPAYQSPDPWDVQAVNIPTNVFRIVEIANVCVNYNQRTIRYADALRTCRAVLDIGNLMVDNADNLIQELAATSVRSTGIRMAHALATEPMMSESDLILLLHTMDGQHEIEQSMSRAYKGEYWQHAGFYEDLPSLGIRNAMSNMPSFVRFIPRVNMVPYMFQKNKTKSAFASEMRLMISNVAFPYKDMQFPTNSTFTMVAAMRPNVIGRMLVQLSSFIHEFVLGNMCNTSASLSATRLVLACKLYERRHGQLPDTLAALVPDYIDAVPRDPFDGQPFRYSKEKGIVYAIGIDLKDNGGATNSQYDIVFELQAKSR